MFPNRARVAVGGVLICVLAALAAASPASAADKPFALVISNADTSTPNTLTGGAEGTVLATYRNLNTQQQLGSSNLAVPSALRVVSATTSAGTATVSGSTVSLRNLNVAPGGSARVTLRVVPSCVAQTLTWTAPVTKQSNNFNGPPGNDLNLDASASALTTVVSGSCSLRFVSGEGPANARIGQAITRVPYTPTGGPVNVEVVDPAGNRVAAAGVPVTISIAVNPGAGTLSGTRTVNTTASGVASFSTLSIDKQGAKYRLLAASAGLASALSGEFNVDEIGVACLEDVNCSGTLGLTNTNTQFGGTSKVDVTAVQGPTTDIDAGFLTISRIGGPLDCANYTELTATQDVIAVDYTALDREKIVTGTIDKRVMNQDSNNGASFLENCFGAPYTFATKPGTPLEVNADYVPGPYPAPEYKGLLPDCGGSAVLDDPALPGVQGATISNAGAPCVQKRNKTNAGDGVITSRWPSGRAVGIGDPRGRY